VNGLGTIKVTNDYQTTCLILVCNILISLDAATCLLPISKDKIMIIKHMNEPVAIDLGNGELRPLILVARARPSGCKATSPSEYRLKEPKI
jgi:hypothetical protein